MDTVGDLEEDESSSVGDSEDESSSVGDSEDESSSVGDSEEEEADSRVQQKVGATVEP